MQDLDHVAIQQALAGQWDEAIATNLTILKSRPQDLDTLNRLGRAYQETGQKTKSAACFEKVLKLDKFNTIAKRNLALLKTSRATRSKGSPGPKTPMPIFLEEPGLTKTVILTRLGDPKFISTLHPGEAVKIVCHEHSVSATSMANQYIGRLPDDISSRLRILLKAGNTYSAWLKNIDAKSIRVFIREQSRSAKYSKTPSFPLTEKLTYAAFTPPELVHEEKPDVSATEDQEESNFSSRDDSSEDLSP